MEAAKTFAELNKTFAERNRSEEKQIRGRVTHLYKGSGDLWSAGIILADSGPYIHSDVKFSIKSRVQENEEIILHGKWVNHSRFGWQFQADSLEYPMPDITNGDGLAEYLANNPSFKGIGPAKARGIAKEYGSNFDMVIREQLPQLAEFARISMEQAENLQKEWIARADVNAIAQWLASFGLTHCQIRKIAEQYGNKAQQILIDNPYVLAEDIHNIGFSRADEIALKMGTKKDHPGRIKACLCDLVKREGEEGGHTYIRRADLIREAVKKLCFDTLEAENLIREQLEVICRDDSGRLVQVESNGDVLIADKHIYQMEMDLYKWLVEGKDNPPDWDDHVAYQLLQAELAMTPEENRPSDSQCAGIEMALSSRISVLSGGAGTGKSFTIAKIHKLFLDEKKTIGLCAPTGKAAKRMSQLANAPASTIHRLLEYNPQFGWFYNEDNKLPYDLIIVDETSMCDISLLWRLFSAIDFTKTQLLMVGDHNQLPPIGAGNVLRDILNHNIVPCHILTQCFRNAGELKANCNYLLDGILRPTTPVLPQGGREWRVVNNLEDPEELIAQLCTLQETYFEKWGFDPVDECQIISPYNKGKLGINRLNWELQKVWQRVKYQVELPEIDPEKFKGQKEPQPRFYQGDKVMQIKNDYKLGDSGVMNGTTGVVRDIYTGKYSKDKMMTAQYMSIKFDDVDESVKIEIGSEQAKNVVLAYACTVHKVQGSEYPCVAAIIHSQHTFMLTRNLAYTAATRARKTAILLGNRLGMRRALATVKSSERRTWMGLMGGGVE
jgi:exodeoxyribonuclease V alpha subunit